LSVTVVTARRLVVLILLGLIRRLLQGVLRLLRRQMGSVVGLILLLSVVVPLRVIGQRSGSIGIIIILVVRVMQSGREARRLVRG